MDIQNNGLEKATSFLNMAIFGIYVKFLGCWFLENILHWFINQQKIVVPEVVSKFLEPHEHFGGMIAQDCKQKGLH